MAFLISSFTSLVVSLTLLPLLVSSFSLIIENLRFVTPQQHQHRTTNSLFCIRSNSAKTIKNNKRSSTSTSCPTSLLMADISTADVPSTLTVESSTSKRSVIKISKPPIHYTVKMNLAYRNEKGDWYDEDGASLEGPPRNHWRQQLDQRAYKNDMDLIDTILDSSITSNIEALVNEVTKVEKSSGGVRFPWMSRKLLGQWAPILHASQRVVITSKEETEKNTNDDNNDTTTTSMEGSVLMDIQRAGGPKFAPKNHYGTFYAGLDENEEITIKSTDELVNAKVYAARDNEKVEIVCEKSLESHVTNKNDVLELPIYLGKITYLSDYILIQRRPDNNDLIDLWLRVDDSYMGTLNPDE